MSDGWRDRCAPQAINHPSDHNHNHHPNSVEKITIALVQEYLYKKNFRATLKQLHAEPGAFAGISDSRAALAHGLRLESLLKENKRNQGKIKRLSSILEVLVKAFLKLHSKQENCANISKNVRRSSIASQTVPPINPAAALLKPGESEGNNNYRLHKEIQTEPAEEASLSVVISSTSAFLAPEQVASPSLSPLAPSEMSNNSNPSPRGSTSPRSIGRSLSQSKISMMEEKEDEDGSYNNDPSVPSIVVPCSPAINSAQTSFDNEFQLKRTNQHNISSSADVNPDHSSGVISLAESLLHSKQNILANGCLTSAEIHKRNKARRRSLSEDSQRTNLAKLGGLPKRGLSNQQDTVQTDTMELRDIEDEDLGIGENRGGHGSGGVIHVRHFPKAVQEVSQLDMTTWRNLKVSTVGLQGFVQDGWMGQGFSFTRADVPFGLVQNKGGPCGVLAVVQALIIKNLMFGSKFSKNLPMTSKEILSTLDEKTSNSYSVVRSRRFEALCAALIEILWRCVPNDSEKNKTSVKICLKGYEPGSELIEINDLKHLEAFVRDNCYRFDCLGLVYSAVLTRGPDRIQEDMDFPDSPLIGQHGYCSLELVNLLLFGKCISNVFDNEVMLDGKSLRGIHSQSDIGFLSLFEHYGSCEVGSFMKSPKNPIWIVSSESHFSVLFSPNVDIVSRDKEHTIFNNGFDLFYYDGLAREQEIIRITISFPPTVHDMGALLTLPLNFSGIASSAVDEVAPDHLVPPLEKCLRTKWKHAKVLWNRTEPLL